MESELEDFEESRCPYCKAKIKVMFGVSVRADIQPAEAPWFREGAEPPYLDYSPRLPNIGVYGDFWPAKIGETDCLTNGFFCLAGAEKLELPLSCEKRQIPDFAEIVEKCWSEGGLPTLRPALCNSWLVQMKGKDGAGQEIYAIARRRDIDFALSMYPKAVFAWSAVNKMFFIQNPTPGSHQIVGLVMAMDDSKCPVRWEKAE